MFQIKETIGLTLLAHPKIVMNSLSTLKCVRIPLKKYGDEKAVFCEMTTFDIDIK